MIRILALARLSFPKAECGAERKSLPVLGLARCAVVVVDVEILDTNGHGVDPVDVVGEGDDGGVAVVGAAA